MFQDMALNDFTSWSYNEVFSHDFLPGASCSGAPSVEAELVFGEDGNLEGVDSANSSVTRRKVGFSH